MTLPDNARITAGLYEGPEATAQAPWKCPRCGRENLTAFKDGCPCGAGQPGVHVGVHAPATPAASRAVRVDLPTTALHAYAQHWHAAHPSATVAEAFIAGYQYAQALTVTAPPVSADLAALAPEGKVTRTIVAALELFRDRILPDAKDEVASGEWCSLEETEELIDSLKKDNPYA